jgi:hypothetical protein
VDSSPGAAIPLAPGVRAAVVVAVLLGYVVAAFRHTLVAVVRDVESYGLEDPAADLLSRELRVLRFEVELLHASRYAGAVGVLIGVGVLGVLDWLVSGSNSAAAWGSGVLLPLMALLLFWVLGRVAYFTVVGASQAAGVTPEEVAIDLLNLRALELFGRIGLRLSLAWIIGISIFTLLLLFLFPNPRLAAVPIVPVMAFTLVIATVALVIPVRGVRRGIRNAKRAALADLAVELRRTRDAALAGDKEIQGHLADLLSYRAFVEALREWPFDTSTLVRFGLYLLIPLGSWLGGAFVERLLAALLD